MTYAPRFDELRCRIGQDFGLSIPPYHIARTDSSGNLTRETLVSQAIFHILLSHDEHGGISQQQAKSIAILGVPLWQIFVRWLLKRIAIAVWRELQAEAVVGVQ